MASVPVLLKLAHYQQNFVNLGFDVKGRQEQS